MLYEALLTEIIPENKPGDRMHSSSTGGAKRDVVDEHNLPTLAGLTCSKAIHLELIEHKCSISSCVFPNNNSPNK